MKKRIADLTIEFFLVFLGVLLAFITNNWSEQQRDQKYLTAITENLLNDIRTDSASIIDAIEVVGAQHDSLNNLLDDLFAMNHNKAKRLDSEIFEHLLSY